MILLYLNYYKLRFSEDFTFEWNEFFSISNILTPFLSKKYKNFYQLHDGFFYFSLSLSLSLSLSFYLSPSL